jgi:nitrogen fixation protein FixH
MRSLKFSFIILASVELFIGACSNQASNSGTTETTPETQTASKAETPTNSEKHTDHSRSSKGGQVVETGKYHLELVPEKEDDATHLDLYLQTGEKHEAVPNAKVTADIQSPDGKQKTVPLTYDANGKHYAAKLDKGVSGQYQVRITANIGGEKVNGRFNFNQ